MDKKNHMRAMENTQNIMKDENVSRRGDTGKKLPQVATHVASPDLRSLINVRLHRISDGVLAEGSSMMTILGFLVRYTEYVETIFFSMLCFSAVHIVVY
jgi:hypothetical protein